MTDRKPHSYAGDNDHYCDCPGCPCGSPCDAYGSQCPECKRGRHISWATGERLVFGAENKRVIGKEWYNTQPKET